MIAIVDYGMGNLRSVQKALLCLGAQANIVSHGDELDKADKVVLPGVGAFSDAIDRLRATGMDQAIASAAKKGKWLFGICLGMQMLFDVSHEDGRHEGLGLIAGEVVKFSFDALPQPRPRIPHMGWNSLHWADGGPLMQGIEQGCYAYFAHSYHVAPSDAGDVCTSTEYGYQFASSIRRGNILATQFHPEKSQSVGLRMLENFIRL